MWCTAGFLHAAGCTVNRDGSVVALEDGNAEAVFGFEAVTVECDEAGRTRWSPADAGQRFIFRVYDTERYAKAMTLALRRRLASSRPSGSSAAMTVPSPRGAMLA